MTALPALAVDLSDTTWDLQGRSRVWARSLGHNFGPMSDQVTFLGDGTFSFQQVPLGGTWVDEGGRRFSGELDDAALEQAIEDFINAAGRVDDADVIEIRVDRIWGHVNRGGDVIKMKLRFKVWYASESLGIVQRGAWIKLRLRGRLVAGGTET